MAQKFLTNFTPPGSNESYKFRAGSLFYGETSNSTTAMSVSIPGVTEYYTGLTLILKMGAQAAANCTLNVNGLGAKKMIYGSSSTGTYFASGATYLFVYDGTQFKAIHSYNSNTTYSVATESANGLLSKEDKIKLNNTNIAYGTCSTAAATAEKVITLNGNTQWVLKNGSLIMVKFANSNTASNVTLNVNGTGAYPIWYNNAAYTSTSSAYCGYKDRTITYMFNGTHWVWISSSYDANTQSNTNSTNTDSKIFIIGATSQGSNKTTYSHDTAYVGTDGCLYSNNTKVSVEGHTHNYAGSSSAGGAANSVKTNLIIKLNGGTTEGTNLFTFNGSTAKTINITPAAIGAAAASHGTHVSYGTTASAVNTAASAGTATTVSRSDHVHSLDKATVVAALGYTPPTSNTTYSAGTGLTLNGTTFNHSNSVTASTAKGSDTKTLTFGGTFALPTVSYDTQGHVTGSGTTTMTMPSDRLFVTLVPTGTLIPANADLNTTTYMKVGRYFCSQTANAKTLQNCPVDVAFMMEVYSPLSTTIDNETTGSWVYRIRKITAYNTGIQFIQYASVGSTANSWTYGAWKVQPIANFTLDTTDKNGGTALTGSTTKPIYLKADGIFAACTYSLNKDVPSDAKFTDTNYYHTPSYTSGLKIGTGVGIADLYIREGNTSTLGVVKQHTSTDCTTYTSDSGATTPAAVKKAVKTFIKAGTNVTTTWDDTNGYTISSTNTDTKNTAGSTNSTSKLFLIGATSQATNPITNSNSEVYGLNGTIHTKGIGADNFVSYPKGGSYTGQDSSLTGYCKITLPVSWTNTMMSFKIRIFNYVTGETTEYMVSGYNYSSSPGWHQCSAICLGKPSATLGNLPVTFGHDGSKCVIAIGEATTKWAYPQVVVHSVLVGYNNNTFDNWNDGWSVGFATAALNNTVKISNTNVSYGATPKSHTHTLTPTTTDIYSITNVGTMFSASVSGEVLTLTAGTAPTRSSAIKAYTGLSIGSYGV